MAAAMARQLVRATLHAESAGISASAGAFATRDAVLAMQGRGLDISGHRSRALSGLALRDFDLVVALTPAIARHLRAVGVEPSRLATLDIPDPLARAWTFIEPRRLPSSLLSNGCCLRVASDRPQRDGQSHGRTGRSEGGRAQRPAAQLLPAPASRLARNCPELRPSGIGPSLACSCGHDARDAAAHHRSTRLHNRVRAPS